MRRSWRGSQIRHQKSVTGIESKHDVVLYDLSECSFEQQIAISKTVSKICKQMISLAPGLFLPYKDERRGKMVHFIEAMCNLVCDG